MKNNLNIILYSATIILLCLSIFLKITICPCCFIYSIGPIISDIAISLLAGSIVYFTTVDFPLKKINKKRKVIINGQLKAIKDYINVRLMKIDVNINNLEEEAFINLINSKLYSDLISIKRRDTTYYEMFNEINARINRLKEHYNLIINIEDSELLEAYHKILHTDFRNSRNIYLNHEIENLSREQLKISIGQSLYNLQFKELSKAIKLTE